MRICVLDDDPSCTEFVAQTLEAAGHSCQAFSEAKDLIHALRRDTFDLLLLDWNMPVMSGDAVLSWVRTHLETNLPVVFLTSRSFEADIVAMLQAGADDYIVKPVSRSILVARVETLLRRAYRLEAKESHLRFGVYDFDLDKSEVSVNGSVVTLAQKEFELALLLFRHVSRPLSRAHIRESVWKQDVDIPSRTIDTHISQIRAKLTLRPVNGYRIAPIYSYGYRLESVEGVENEAP
jgi:DNA-binding response OmpR family regulator